MALPLRTGPVPNMPECHRILTAPGMPWELEEKTLKGHKYKVWKNAPPTFRVYLDEMFKQWADREFVSSPLPEPSDFDARETLTYKQVYDRAVQIAAFLRGQGVKAHDRVAVGGANSSGWVISFVAAHLLGAVPVMLNNALQDEAQIHCLTVSGPVAVLVDEQLAKDLARIAPVLKSKGVGPIYAWSSIAHHPAEVRAAIKELPTTPQPEKLVKEVLDGAGLETLNPESPGTIFFTSGTTSLPKAVLSTQRQTLHNIQTGSFIGARAALRAGLSLKDLAALQAKSAEGPQMVMLIPVPLFHATGCSAMLMRCIALGGKIVFLRRWSVPYAVKVIVQEGVNFLGGVPAIATAIVQSPLLPKDHQFATVSYGGAPPAKRLEHDLNRRFPGAMIAHGWGMTETNAPVTQFMGQDYAERPTSCGYTLPICDIRIVDPETRKEVPSGEPGLVLVRGSNVMDCYYNNAKATAEVFDKDMWLDTGDIGYVDADGFLHLSDRAKDIIIRGGENIPSAEVENVITDDERIAEAAAVAVPDDVLGELVAVAVSFAPNASATEEELLARASANLRYAARPVMIVIYDELPRNANGKIVKADIKKHLKGLWLQRQEKKKAAPRAKL